VIGSCNLRGGMAEQRFHFSLSVVDMGGGKEGGAGISLWGRKGGTAQGGGDGVDMCDRPHSPRRGKEEKEKTRCLLLYPKKKKTASGRDHPLYFARFPPRGKRKKENLPLRSELEDREEKKKKLLPLLPLEAVEGGGKERSHIAPNSPVVA